MLTINIVLVRKQATYYMCIVSCLSYRTTQNDCFKKIENERSVYIKGFNLFLGSFFIQLNFDFIISKAYTFLAYFDSKKL